MKKRKASFFKIKIVENERKIINLTIPLFLISSILFLIPTRLFKKITGEEMDLKRLIKELVKEGRGTRIQVTDEDTQVHIEVT